MRIRLDCCDLEPRELFSAAPWIDPAALVVAGEGGDVEVGETPQPIGNVEIGGEPLPSPRRELIVYDATIDGVDVLIEDFVGALRGRSDVSIAVLDPHAEGVGQLATILSQYADLDAVHVLTHGTAAGWQLGGTNLSLANIEQYAAVIGTWSVGLAPGADLLLYGCELAAFESGEAWLAELARLSGADLAASRDVTGASGLGGNWQLEYRLGQIESLLAVDESDEWRWQGTLDTVAVQAESRVNSVTAGTQETSDAQQAVATNAAGNGVVVWTSNTGLLTSTGIFAQRYQDGIAVGAPFVVNTAILFNQSDAVVGMGAGGEFVVAWSSLLQDGLGWGVYAQRFAADGSRLGGEFRVNTSTIGNQQSPSIAMNGAGDFVIAWVDGFHDGSGSGIYAQRFAANGSKLGGEFRINSTTANDQAEVRLAMNAGGDWVATWSSFGQDGSSWGVYAQHYSPQGNPLGGEFQVAQTTFGAQSRPAAAIDDFGTFTIAWQSAGQDPDGSTGIYARRFDAAGLPQGDEFRVTTTFVGSQTNASVAAHGDGSFIVTWQAGGGQDGSGQGVFAQVFDELGRRRGGEFRVTTSTLNDQLRPSAAWNDERVTIVWSGAGPGDNSGVFLQRFRLDASSLWFTTDGAVNDSSLPGLSQWTPGSLLAWSVDPLGPGLNAGQFSLLGNLDPWALDGAARITAIDWVGQSVMLGTGAASFTIEPGDVLLAVDAVETLVSLNTLTVAAGDVFVFRPSQPGDYRTGTFHALLDQFSTLHGGSLTLGLALVDRDTWLGDVLLPEGSLLVSRDGLAEENDLFLFTPGGVGVGGTVGIFEMLIEGDDWNLEGAIWGLELVTATTMLGSVQLDPGTLLLSFDRDQAGLGSGGLNATRHEIVAWNVVQTTLGSGVADASASSAFDGSAVGLSGNAGRLQGIALLSASNQAPQVNISPLPVLYVENGAPIVLDATATFVDPDSLDFDRGRLSVRIVAGGESSDQLAILDQGIAPGAIGRSGSDVTFGGIVIGTWAGGDSLSPLVVTFNAQATSAAIETLLRNVTFVSLSEAPSAAVRTLSWFVSDGDGGTSVTTPSLVSVEPVNDPPTLVLPGPLSTLEDTALTFSALVGTAFVLDDADAGNAELMATLTATRGTLALANLSGLTILVGQGSGDTQLIVLGTLDALRIAFDGLTYTPDPDEHGTASIHVLLDDLGSHGSGGAGVAQGTISITIEPVNDPPAMVVPGEQTLAEDSSLVFSSSTGNEIVLDDIDAGLSSLELHLAVGHGTLSLGSTIGLSFEQGAADGSGELVIRGTLVDLNAALEGLRYTPAADWFGDDTLTITFDDRGAQGWGGPASVTRQVPLSVEPVNDPPQLILPGPQQSQGLQLLFSRSAGNAIQIVDRDANDTPLRLTLTAEQGVLSLGDNTWVTILAGNPQGADALVLEGTLTALKGALDGLRFHPLALESRLVVRVDDVYGDLPAHVVSGTIEVVQVPLIVILPEPDVRPEPTGPDRREPIEPEWRDDQWVLPVDPEGSTFDTQPRRWDGTTIIPRADEPREDQLPSRSSPSERSWDDSSDRLGVPNPRPMARAVNEPTADEFIPWFDVPLEDSAALESEAQKDSLLAAVGGASLLLSAGYVLWVIHSGAFVTSLLTLVPSWMSFDPLPVLDAWERDARRLPGNGAADEDDEDDPTERAVAALLQT